MRTLMALVMLAPFALAQDAAAPKPAEAPKGEVSQLVPPDPLPGAALPKDAAWQTTASGLRWVVLEKGDETAAKPGIDAIVSVYYAGWLESGTLFDEAKSSGPVVSFPLTRVIKGWTEGVQLMQEGAVYKFVIPASLGYGSEGAGGRIPPDATLVFQIELLKVGA